MLNKLEKINIILFAILAISCQNNGQSQFLWHTKNVSADIPVPVFFGMRHQDKNIALVRDGSVFPVQSEADSAWVILYPGKVDTGSILELKQLDSGIIRSSITTKHTDSVLTLIMNDRPVLTYVTGLTNVPGRDDSLYIRNGFIHPLWSPDGAVLTRIHPEDHYHHLGLWHPWTKAVFRGNEIDFWNLGDLKGTIRYKRMINIETGSVFTSFTAEHVWYERLKNRQILPVINEKFNVRLWDIPDLDGFLIDYNYDQQCAVDDSVQLPEYRYGGIGFRGTDEWQGQNRFYLSSEGDNLKTADGSRARWCIVGGETSKGPASILFMSHPANHEHPEPMRIWGDFADDVFFNFCPVKQKSWTFHPGEIYRFRYRIFISDNILSAEVAEKLWKAYAEPGFLEQIKLKE